MDILDAIKQIPYYAEVNASAWVYLAEYARRQTVEAQEIVLLEGEMTKALFIVESGGLKAVRISPTGREQSLHFIEAGETFNEISVLADSGNPVTVIALETCTLWKIEQAIVWQMLTQYPDTAKVVIQQLARRFQMLLLTIEDLSLRTVEARLARYLLKQSAESSPIIERARWATQAELANRLGTVSDVLHRAFRALERENLICVERRKVTVLDWGGLQLRSELDK